jgi:hypothetical protein
MIVTIAKWETIRHLFDEVEKIALNSGIAGETVCPRGVVIDEQRISAELLEKLRKGLAA